MTVGFWGLLGKLGLGVWGGLYSFARYLESVVFVFFFWRGGGGGGWGSGLVRLRSFMGYQYLVLNTPL